MVFEEILPSGVRSYSCETWEEFISEIRNEKYAVDRIFRGHTDSNWKLSSVWERWLKTKKPGRDETRSVREVFAPGAMERIRDSYLSTFKDLIKGVPEFRSDNLKTDVEWWAIGRHYGLKTPLLDWSFSPYVAAFFAFSECLVIERFAPKSSVAIWGLVLEELIFKPQEFEFVHSRTDNAHRQKAQAGVFTNLIHDVHLDVESYLASKHQGVYLEKYLIPTQECFKAIVDLSLMNISYASLFPDLEGAVKQTNFLDTLLALKSMVGK